MEERVGKISNLRSVAKVLERFIISIPAAIFQHCFFFFWGGGEEGRGFVKLNTNF